MITVTLKEFSSNKTSVLNKVLNGEEVYLQSRLGSFRIISAEKNTEPELSLTQRICNGLKEVKEIQEGKAKGYTLDEVLNEL